MFTGIITDIGVIARVEAVSGQDTVLEVQASGAADAIALGASISHAGVCLTVIARGDRAEGGCWWTVQASAETVSATTLGEWRAGDQVNLERALRFGDELGGHLVAGHVDGVGEIVSVHGENESWRLKVRAPVALSRYIAQKGSIAIDGVSLTVNEVEGDVFGVNIIPHTWTHTTLGGSAPGQRVNLEADLLARYVARMMKVDG